MIDGLMASRRFSFTVSQAARLAAAARASVVVTARPLFIRKLISVVVVEGSEVEVQTELENRRLRERLEFGRCVVAARRRIVAFRIAAAIVRPLLDVAGREYEGRVVGAGVTHQSMRQLERHRSLAPLHEG